MKEIRSDFPWVIIRLKNELYALSARDVQTMVAMPHIVDVPNKPHWIRGVVNMRGKVIPLMDLRLRLDMESYIQEIDDLIMALEQREQEHRGWLEELKRSVEDDRDFRKETDPHKCAFGRWYDTYQAPNLSTKLFLRRFDKPHRAIHEIAHKVENMKKAGEHEKTMNTIEMTKDGELATMIKLFFSVQGNVARP